MTKKMRILISNDDGIYSPGITALAKVASRFGKYASSRPMWNNFATIIVNRPRPDSRRVFMGFEGLGDLIKLGHYSRK
jgi:hypothetical protein